MHNYYLLYPSIDNYIHKVLPSVTSTRISNACLNNLNIISLNCRSIRSQSKRANLLVLLNDHQADIVIGCESHLDSSIISSELLPSTYNIFRKDRSLGGGGVFIGTKNHLTVVEENLQHGTDAEFICVKLYYSGITSHIYMFFLQTTKL